MRPIKLTSIEKRDVAIVADEVVSIERGDYIDWELEKKYGFAGRPTRVFLKNSKYSVREDFETVCALMEGADRKTESQVKRAVNGMAIKIYLICLFAFAIYIILWKDK